MVPFAIFTFLCGIVLSYRFAYPVLFPTMAMIASVVVAAGIAGGLGGRWIMLTSIAVVFTLQLAYLVGILLHAAYAALRADRGSNRNNRPQTA